MTYANYIDILMQHYADGDFASEAVQAKNEFYDLAGIFDEQTQNFEMKMAQFTDWYIFIRTLSKLSITPAADFVKKRPSFVKPEEWTFYDNLANSRASLFEFKKISKSDLYVKDLFSSYKLVIKNSAVTDGFRKDEYFQARLIPHEDTFQFSGTFCFHPPEATKFINQEIKKVLKSSEEERALFREKLIVRLFRMRHKYEQYQHVGIQEIYSNESRLRI
jgi:hypothetical protein